MNAVSVAYHGSGKIVALRPSLNWRSAPCRTLVLRPRASSTSSRPSSRDKDEESSSTAILDRYRVFPPTPEIIAYMNQQRQRVLHKIDPKIYQQVYQETWQAQQRNVSVDSMWAVGPAGKYQYQWTTTNTSDHRDQSHRDQSLSSRMFRRIPSGSLDGTFSPATLLTLPKGTSLSASPCLSGDERIMAYIQAADDSENRAVTTLTIVDTETQQTNSCENLPPNMVHVEVGASHAHGCDVFLVQADPDDGRPHRIWKGFWSTEDPSSFSTSLELTWSIVEDPKLYLHVQRTKGGEYVTMQAQSLNTNTVHLLGPRSASKEDWYLVAAAQPGRTHHVDVGAAGEVFVLVKDGQQGHCLVETAVSQLPIRDDPSSLDHHSVNGFEITEIDIYRYWLVLYETSTWKGTPRIRVVDRRTRGDEWVIDVPHSNVAQMYKPVHNAWYNATVCRFQVDTPVCPCKVYEYNFVSRELEEVSPRDENSESSFYDGERTVVSSLDGTMVPLSIVHGRNVNRNGTIPVVLTAYGAYGENLDLSYNPAWQPLLKRGYVLAFAHIRGGGELGAKWHAQGRHSNKENGTHDYLACARALRQYLLGGEVRLIAKAFSAGGVAVASAVNREPGFFDDMVVTNAFLDVFTTMCNPHLALTEHEWDEYGNPLEDEGIASLIRSYCPVQSAIATNRNPRTLLIGALHDESVPYWNAIVYAEALKRESTSCNDVCLLMEDNVKHDLGFKLLHVSSIENAFILADSERE